MDFTPWSELGPVLTINEMVLTKGLGIGLSYKITIWTFGP